MCEPTAEILSVRDSRCGRILTTAKAAGNQWPPLQAGLLGGSTKRSERAADWVWVHRPRAGLSPGNNDCGGHLAVASRDDVVDRQTSKVR
jgi:hypothetical protein